MDKQQINNITKAANAQPDIPLPLRADAPGAPECDPPQRDISKTTGGKATDFFIYKVLGFAGNSALSVGVTYWINPKPKVKEFRERVTKGAQALFKGFIPEGAVGNATEIGFMLIAGTALTSIMVPLVNRRDKIAYWVNQKLGTDTDVLPEAMQQHGTPYTLEDKIQQELKKNVNYGQTSRDLWKARWSGVLVPLIGDTALGKLSAQREAENKWSIDTMSWKMGQHLYDEVLPQQSVKKMGEFFSKHGAGIEDMKVNNPGNYERLSKVEDFHDDMRQKMHGKASVGSDERNDRMMIADQTRLLGKEVGWTLVLSEIVERSTSQFQHRRIRKQERKAIAKMYEEGVIPSGIHVVTLGDGRVELKKTKGYAEPVQESPPQSHQPSQTQPELAPEAELDTKRWADDRIKQVAAPAPTLQASLAAEDRKEATKNWADDMVKNVTKPKQPAASNTAAVQAGRQKTETQPSIV